MLKNAIIVAAGLGMRMHSSIPKQFLLLNGKPLLWYTIKAFIGAYNDIQIILVLPETYLESGKPFSDEFSLNKISIIAGGETRFHSVKNGLRMINDHSIVFVHDGVRCLVSSRLIRQCYETAIEKGNAVPAIKPADTIRIETENGNRLIDRNKIYLIQTPQTFYSDVLKKAFEQEYQEHFTDEASLVEEMGININLVEGEYTNIKITTPIDLVIAENFLTSKVLKF